MSGEGGYYFTNLSCAITFIENLSNESLSLSKEEFDEYLSANGTINTPWETALMACSCFNDISENIKDMEELNKRNKRNSEAIVRFEDALRIFNEEIDEKINSTLSRAPLCIRPIKTPKKNYKPDAAEAGHYQSNLLVSFDEVTKNKADIDLPFVASNKTNDANFLNFTDNLFGNSPSGPSPFDDNSLNGLATPEEYLLNATSDYQSGLTNINYDFDLSDLSGENSIAENIENIPTGATDEFDPFGECSAQDEKNGNKSILDTESPNQKVLPSPLKPVVEYKGFSNFEIPTITCNKGSDFIKKSTNEPLE